jgi:hypothetical protein
MPARRQPKKRSQTVASPSRPREAAKDIGATGIILHCNFCGAAKRPGLRFIRAESTDSNICGSCLDLGAEMLLEDGEALPLIEHAIKGPDLTATGPAPRFPRIDVKLRPNHCFYLCPFREPFDTIYRDHAKPAVEAQGFTVERVDEVYGTEPIIDDIWVGINSAAFVIADLTTRNGNVMYEVGLAHTVGKPVIMVTQAIDDVPFDLRHYRCIVYEFTPKGMKALEEKLTRTLAPRGVSPRLLNPRIERL